MEARNVQKLSAISLPTGEEILLPGMFDASELSLAGNCRFVHSDLLYAYDPTTGTGLAWCRYPRPHWQLIQPVTRAGFEEWAGGHSNMMSMGALKEIVQGINNIVTRCEQANRLEDRRPRRDQERRR